MTSFLQIVNGVAWHPAPGPRANRLPLANRPHTCRRNPVLACWAEVLCGSAKRSFGDRRDQAGAWSRDQSWRGGLVTRRGCHGDGFGSPCLRVKSTNPTRRTPGINAPRRAHAHSASRCEHGTQRRSRFAKTKSFPSGQRDRVSVRERVLNTARFP